MMKISQNRPVLTLIALALLIVGATTFFVLNADKLNGPRAPEVQVKQIVDRGFDTSHSLYIPEETESIKKNIDERLAKFLDGRERTVLNLIDAARAVSDIRDFDQALALFAVADTMNPQDLFYKIDVGRIYMERQQWEAARAVFEPMKVTWPVHEAYLGLAEAYKHIEGTPNYVIDQIYEESLYRHDNNFEVVQAYAEWLEKTDREQQTLKYYEIMNRINPQPLLENKIAELKAKYPSAN